MNWKTALTAAGATLAGALLFLIFLVIATAQQAAATWKPEYAQLPQAVRDWYQSRELTPAAQARFHFKSCCAQSDVVKAKFAVSKLSGADQWFYQLAGEDFWRRVPDDIIHWDQHAPSGEAVLFAVGSQPTCFFPPEGGL